jgi:hypothetical protein
VAVCERFVASHGGLIQVDARRPIRAGMRNFATEAQRPQRFSAGTPKTAGGTPALPFSICQRTHIAFLKNANGHYTRKRGSRKRNLALGSLQLGRWAGGAVGT